MTSSRNPISGFGCSGIRAMFKVRAIDPHTLFIPIEMKSLPQIRQLMQGVSPLTVFNTDSISDARKAFRRLRKVYDFDYWAIKEYFIQDVSNPDSIIPLRLNDAQHHVIDILRKRLSQKKTGRYVISKSIRLSLSSKVTSLPRIDSPLRSIFAPTPGNKGWPAGRNWPGSPTIHFSLMK